MPTARSCRSGARSSAARPRLLPATRLSASAWRRTASSMKAPEPNFTSMASPCSPAASFFDRIEAVIRSMRLDCRGHVADRVEALVSRGEISRLPDDGASDLSGYTPERFRYRAGRHSRESSRVCRACRPYGRDRVRRSSARIPPQAATAGASTRLTVSPTPPVECLSSTGPGRSHAAVRPSASSRR